MNGRYCVVIPAFQAAKTIGALVNRVKNLGLSVLVVDDGSRDQTASVAAGQGAVVISHLRNKGKGAALRTGFEYALRAQYDGVITMDGDGQHDPGEITLLIHEGERQHAAIVVGDRLASQTIPTVRRWTNHLMSVIVSRMVRQRIPDSQSGFRLIRREVLATTPLTTRHFEIETELLLAASRHRWKIISVPVKTSYHNHVSHIRPIVDGVRFFQVLLRHFFAR